MPNNHKLSNNKDIDITNLKNEILIHSLSGSGIRHTIERACNNAGFHPSILYETESLEMAFNLVKRGLGISVVPTSYLKSINTEQVKIIPFKNDLYKRSVYVAYHNKRYLPETFNELLEIFSEIN